MVRVSRVGVTARARAARLRRRVQRPRVLVSGSAVGYYGDRANEVLTEDSASGSGFLADLCRDWEDEAREAEALGLRVVLLRTGVALGRGGGALAQMLPAFRLGVGGPIGSGRQYLPWIHLHDLVAVVVAALGDDRFRGPVNGVSPEPVTSRDFARALGRALRAAGRPAGAGARAARGLRPGRGGAPRQSARGAGRARAAGLSVRLPGTLRGTGRRPESPGSPGLIILRSSHLAI